MQWKGSKKAAVHTDIVDSAWEQSKNEDGGMCIPISHNNTRDEHNNYVFAYALV